MRIIDGRTFRTVGEVAQAAGVSRQTLRVWETKGLVSPERRTSGGQRLYSERDLERANQVAIMRRRHGWNPAAIRSSLSTEPGRRAWSDLSLGARVRAARRASGFTLAQMATRMGISRSYLSALERGESELSQKLLSKVGDLCNIPISTFSAVVKAPGGRLMRREDRTRTPVGGGVIWEELVSPGHLMEPAQMNVPPGGSSGGLYSRPGEIFLLLLSGTLTITTKDENDQTNLREGDSLVLPPQFMWSWENAGSVVAQAIYVELLPPSVWQELNGDVGERPEPDGSDRRSPASRIQPGARESPHS